MKAISILLNKEYEEKWTEILDQIRTINGVDKVSRAKSDSPLVFLKRLCIIKCLENSNVDAVCNQVSQVEGVSQATVISQ